MLNVYGHLFRGLQDDLASRLASMFEASRAAKMRPNRCLGSIDVPIAEAE